MGYEASIDLPWVEISANLGLELQRRRVALGLSQEELAHRAGLTRAHYQVLERGRTAQGNPSNPTMKVLLGLGVALDATLDELIVL